MDRLRQAVCVKYHCRQPASLLLKALLTSSNPLHACNLDLESAASARLLKSPAHGDIIPTRLYQALACARIQSIYPQVSIRKEMWEGRKEETTLCISISREAPRGCVCTRRRAISRESPPQALPSLPSSPPSRLRTDTETQSEQQASVYQFCHLYKGANQESEKERARGESGQQETKMHTGVKASTQMLPSVWPSIAALA